MKVLVFCVLVSLLYIGDTKSHYYRYGNRYGYGHRHGFQHGFRHHHGFHPFGWRRRPLETVKQLDIQRYLGRWYGMYTSKSTQQRIRNLENAVCRTADYRLRADGKINVFNANRQFFPDGKPLNITGFAFNPDPSEPGKYKVQFPNSGAPGDYWILKLGPKTFGPLGLYEYSIVSGATRRSLFVISREKNSWKFNRRFGHEVLRFLKKAGFVSEAERPIPTLQSPKCLYPD